MLKILVLNKIIIKKNYVTEKKSKMHKLKVIKQIEMTYNFII
jgi:hypothetical protein